MRRSKLVGLTVVAMFVVAAVSSGSAAASETTALCRKAEESCGLLYANGTSFQAWTQLETKTGFPIETTYPAVPATLATGFGTVECGSTTKATNGAGRSFGALPGEITSLSWSNCHLGATTCTVTSVNLPYKASLTAEGAAGNGVLVAQSSGKGNPGATVVCGSIINCTYTTAAPSLAITGGPTDSMEAGFKAVAKSIALSGAGGKCTSAKWSATYVLVLSEGVWVET